MQKYFSTTLRLWKLLKPFHGVIYFQIILIFVTQLTTVSFTILFSKIIDALVSKNIHTLTLLTLTFPIVALISAIASYLADRNDVKSFGTTIQQYLEEFSFKKIFSLNAFQYLESHSAIKLQVINRGESAIEAIIQTLTLQGLPILFSFAISIAAISYYSISVTIWTLVTFSILIYSTTKFNTYFNPLLRINMDNWDNQRKVRSEAFNHLLLIKLSGQEELYLKKYLSRRLAFIAYSIKIWLTNAQYINGRNFFIYLSRFVSLILVIILFLKGHTTLGAVYAIFSWTSDIYNNIRNLNAIFRQLPIRFVELEKYLDIIDRTPVFEEKNTTHYIPGDIVFDNLTFAYPSSNDDVLHSISLTIPQGKKVAFVGHSGSGKSTITRLLLRMYDWKEGEITIGNIRVRDVNLEHLRNRIGYVEQHVDLFDDTVKENILFGVTEHNYIDAESRLNTVAQQARIDQFYHRLGETGLNTFIGERGIKLSGGERQRVGIARAIIKNPDILIFDEATASLDTANEAKVMEAINDVSKGKTTIIIAHRLSTVRDADKIIVMDKGRIVGEGTHDELIQNNEVYQNLLAHQM